MKQGTILRNQKVNDKELNEAMLNRIKDSGVKDRLIKEIGRTERVALANQITKEVTGE